MVSHLSGFRLAKFHLTTVAREPLALPEYKGSALRGGFGHVFRKIGCMASSLGASECTLRERCPYHYIFETPPPAGSQILSNVPTAPQPFVLEPPLDTKRFYEPGEELSFGLVLIGRAIDYLPYFIYAFDELGRNGIGKGKGKYQLCAVTSVDGDGKQTQIYWPEKHLLKDGFSILRADDLFSPLPNSDLTLHFLTPTRIKYGEHLTDSPEFHVLFRSLLRRISLLNYFHCDGELHPAPRPLIEKAGTISTSHSTLRWHDWQRYSNRQQTTMTLGGFMGEVTFQGDLTEFLPYLRLGERVHMGKGATFGLGQYRVIQEERERNA